MFKPYFAIPSSFKTNPNRYTNLYLLRDALKETELYTVLHGEQDRLQRGRLHRTTLAGLS